jgi:uncharacterized protein YjbJ (UPF0337 family)
MNKDKFAGKWEQIRNEAKGWWGRLTDADLDRIAGKLDVFAGVLHEKYGYTPQRAVREIDRHVAAFDASLNRKTVPSHRN